LQQHTLRIFFSGSTLSWPPAVPWASRLFADFQCLATITLSYVTCFANMTFEASPAPCPESWRHRCADLGLIDQAYKLTLICITFAPVLRSEQFKPVQPISG
jgi:hypothetical protein